MKKWYSEDWQFTIDVLQVGKENKAEECRAGLEAGDIFTSKVETPTGFCPTAFIKIFPSLETLRCGGHLRSLRGTGPADMIFQCPDGPVKFRLTSAKVLD
ncbi:MAG: TIGR04076 family protein [Anaerolineales bacterium]|jgi:uncharacterized repeat protein (TIGR04076 family)